jgi:hypothetical protein
MGLVPRLLVVCTRWKYGCGMKSKVIKEGSDK